MKRHLFLSCALFIMASMALQAQPTLIEKVEPVAGKVIIPYERWKLPNGLTILLHEDHSDPVVNVSVLYKVGSNRESVGKSGFAHFFEHMMFQGSKHVADEEHIKLVSSAGGNMNGFTQRDETVYYETLPSNYLELGLWLESDRMGFLLDSLTPKKFENQRNAVKNEKSQNVENIPYGLSQEEIGKILYPPGHPYSWDVIGFTDDLNRATVEDAKNFFLRWYGPNNAVLAIAGDFKPAEALALADKYFGSLKPCPEVKKLRLAPVTIASDKYGAYKDNVILPLSLRVYPTVPMYHRDEPALDVLGDMMLQGKNSIFYKRFVKSKYAVQAGGGHRSSELSGEFTIEILADAPEDFNYEKTFSDIDKKVKETLQAFEDSCITDENLNRIKSQYETGMYAQLNTVFNKGLLISNWEKNLGRSSNLSEELDRYAKVTREDIIRVFNKYIKGSGAAILSVYPNLEVKDSIKSVNPYLGLSLPEPQEYKGLSYAPNPEKFDRAVRPIPGAPSTPKVPDYYNKKLANGLNIVGTKTTEGPIINMSFNLDGGSLVLPKEKWSKLGITEMTAMMMNEGTKNYSNEQIEAELDKLGSNITFFGSRGGSSIQITSLKKNLDPTLKLLEEMLLNPGFRAEDFKVVKKRYKSNTKNEAKDANATAGKVYSYAVYGSDNILGLSPTVKTIDNIQLTDLAEYYDKYYSPSQCNLIIVGDLDESEIMPKLEFLNKWKKRDFAIPIPVDPPQNKEPKFFVSHKELASSSVIMMGYPSLKFDVSGDFYKNRVANFVFGGSFNSRLNLNLREDKGYTYGIRSGFGGGKYNGMFSISAAVKRPATALSLAEIIKEFKKYQTDGISDKELEFTKSSMLNAEALQYESPGQKANFLGAIVRYNLSKDFPSQQAAVLRAMTKADVNNQIKNYFDLNKVTTVVVGDKWIIQTQIDKLLKDSKYKDDLKVVDLKKISLD